MIQGTDKNDLKMPNKIRLLLSTCSIPFEIPENLKVLKEFTLGKNNQNKNWSPDGPAAITIIRNSLVHYGNLDDSFSLFNDKNQLLIESLQLSLYYIERCLLWKLDFKGPFINRFNQEDY